MASSALLWFPVLKLLAPHDLHLHHERQNWRPFARAVFVPLRDASAAGLLRLIGSLSSQSSSSRVDFLAIDEVAPNTFPREWHALVHDHIDDTRAFNRRQLEVVAILELANAIKAGEVFVNGSLSFDRFWDRISSDAADPAAIEKYAIARGRLGAGGQKGARSESGFPRHRPGSWATGIAARHGHKQQ